ncbi:hypothetical protein GCM10012285_61510 [Streptomyces kronopolitis]|uniref:Ribbon-helix-helix protein CopG domain-containing protein n=2 Tax=Streptomyces kronopolitis TaxID=1612435 RepID=A0ABQ2JZC9_9ACTN|nr:hypothetical protein GCM10012285_61510 [Streptomyces kronopolitis]
MTCQTARFPVAALRPADTNTVSALSRWRSQPSWTAKPSALLYRLLYSRGMSKPVTIRVDDQLHALLKERAEAEGTTVTALIARAAHDAVRDPRLEGAAEVFRAFVNDNADAFDAAFPEDAPSRLDAPGRAA